MKLHTIAFAAIAFAATAQAQETSVGTFSGSVALTSDYVFRGYSQSDEHPAFQPGLNWTTESGFHANIWASNIDFNDGGDADIEADFTAGFAGAVDKFSYDIGAIYYAYPGTKKKSNYNYWEGYTTFGYDTGTVKLNGSLFYSPDFFGGLDDAWAVQGGFSVPMMEGLVFDAQLGKQLLKKTKGSDYTYWNAGLTYSLSFADVGIRYHDTNVANKSCAGLCGPRAVLTLSKSF